MVNGGGKNEQKINIFDKKFAYIKKKQYFCSRFRSKRSVGGIAQLVRAHDS